MSEDLPLYFFLFPRVTVIVSFLLFVLAGLGPVFRSFAALLR